MLLTNRLFFEQVEAMLAEGHEVQIRMKGHSMRPLLRNERDIAVLTPIAKYAPAPVPAAGAPADPVPETRAADGNASTARQTRLSGDTPGTAPDLHTPACGTRHPAPPPSGIGALRTGDVVLFRCEGRHILHRIVGIETGVRCEGNRPVCAPAAGNAPSPAASAENPAERDSAAGTLRFTLSGDGNYRTTEHCLGKDIVAVMTAVILPSGRIVRTSSRRWKRRSRRWLALPRGVRRFVLRVMWRLGIRPINAVPGKRQSAKKHSRPANETAAPECVCFQHKALRFIEFPQLADTPLQVTDTPPLMMCYHDAGNRRQREQGGDRPPHAMRRIVARRIQQHACNEQDYDDILENIIRSGKGRIAGHAVFTLDDIGIAARHPQQQPQGKERREQT